LRLEIEATIVKTDSSGQDSFGNDNFSRFSGSGTARHDIFEHILGLEVGASKFPPVSAQERGNKRGKQYHRKLDTAQREQSFLQKLPFFQVFGLGHDQAWNI
jgi:hypothetical protein